MFVSETFVVEDCVDYDALTSNNNKFSLTSGSATVSYSNDGLSVVGSSTSLILYMYQGTLPSNYVVEVDVESITLGTYNGTGEVIASHTSIMNRKTNSTTWKTTLYSHDASYSSNTYTDYTVTNVPFHLKVTVSNGTATYYIDDTQLGSRTAGTNDLGIKSYQNRGIVIKNLKIKPL